MTIDEIVEISKLAGKDMPTGVGFLDDIFSAVDSAVYYRFLYHLVKKLDPNLVVELGVYRGGCTAHMAEASSKCKIIAVDPNPEIEFGPILGKYPNINFKMDISTSKSLLDSIQDKSVDLCFIDTVHEYDQVMDEYFSWAPKIKSGGIILFDDISENPGMIMAWSQIVGLYPFEREKVSLPHLHHSGFGVVLMPQ